MTPICPACQGPADDAYRTYDYNQRLSQEDFNYYLCQQCGLVFLDPVPENLGQYYPQTYYAIPNSLSDLAREATSKRYQIDLVRRFVKGGRLLDIGPGHGAFAFLANEAGFDVSTIEMDAICCQFLREEIGVSAIQSDNPAEVLPHLEPQNAITLWHVIEHLPDPWTTLARAVQQLAPGGILLIAAPNPQALQFRLFRSRWVHLDAPRHVRLLPVQLLVRRLVNEGLRPVLVTTGDPGGRALNRYGWRASMINLSEQRLPRAAGWRLGWPLGLLAAPLEQSGLRGSAYTAIFRKPEVSVTRHTEPTR